MQKGFTLLELILVAGVIAIVLAALPSLWRRVPQGRAETAVVDEYVNEALMLMRASRNYAETNQSVWAPNSVNIITIPQLVTAQQLPSSFGTRATGSDRSPAGNVWRIVAIRNATGPSSRIVVTETGAANGAELESIGMQANGSDVARLKARVALALVGQRVPAATVAGGTTSAVGGGSNPWTKDLSAFFAGATPTQPVIAGLIGFPDLDAAFDPNPMSAARYGDCPVAPAVTGSYGLPTGNGTCPVGTTEVGSWPACGSGATVYAVGFQAVTVGVPVPERSPALNNTCTSASNWREPPCDELLMNQFDVVIHTINASTVSRSVCLANVYNDSGMVFNWPQQLVANSAPRHKLCCYPKP